MVSEACEVNYWFLEWWYVQVIFLEHFNPLKYKSKDKNQDLRSGDLGDHKPLEVMQS